MAKPIPYYVLAILLSVPAVLVGVEGPAFVRIGTAGTAFQSDFRVFFTPAYMLRTGQAELLYDFPSIQRNEKFQVAADNGATPYLHPAYEALLFLPLTFLPYRTAYLVWAGVNVCILGGIYRLLWFQTERLRSLGPSWISAGLILGFFPVGFTILAGQDSLLLLLAVVLSFRAISSHEFSAGLLLGLGIFRFQVLLPIVFLLLIWGRYKAVLGWMTTLCALLGVSAMLTGIAAQVQYVKLLFAMGRFSYWPLIRRMPNLRGLLSSAGIGVLPVLLLSLALVLLVALRGARERVTSQLLLSMSVSSLVTYFLFMHDVSLLVLPILATLENAAAQHDWRMLIAVCTIPLFYAIFWFIPDRFYLGAIFTSMLLGLQMAKAAATRSSSSQDLETT